ncbi:MAG: aminotransferase class I/II-fold pyridoxal phosphate-dependent enzyme, partial [Candidatus Liptonbacteria bacterium]|nr:aminotransferase class I/II-fold pyridoxal phosphate-dependent enzyme [Candidatus Liptonbacteria bacterium]
MVKKAILRVVDRRTHSPYEEHPNVQKLEAVVSQKAGGLRVLGTNGGTDALILALKLSGVGPGDEVVVPAFCFIPRISCVPWVGATPVFVDVRLDDYAMDPAKIEEKITERTKAIIVSHLFGQPAAGIADVLFLAKRRGLIVIEDATQSFGAKMKIGGESEMVGTLGDFGALSFTTQKWFAG